MKLSTSQKFVAIATGLAITLLEATAIHAAALSVASPSPVAVTSDTIAAVTTKKRKKKKTRKKVSVKKKAGVKRSMKKPVGVMNKPNSDAMKKPDGAEPDAGAGEKPSDDGGASPMPSQSP
jgi:hypothetical protein